MKVKSIIIVLIALIGTFGISMTLINSKIEVPEVVKNAFAAKYPNVQKVKWEMEDTDEYEAEFKINRKEMSANFNADGTWLETEVEIKKKHLPQAVKDAIAAQFPDYEIEEAEQIETPQYALAYEVELENDEDDTELEVIFAADGTLLKRSMEEEEEDDDNH